jgi:hypothetical protein
MPGSPALFWEAFPYGSVATDGLQALFFAARDAMENAGLTDVIIQQRDVAGRTSNSHAAITFIEGTHTTAVIVAAGDDALIVLQKLVKELKKITFI